MSGNGSEDDNIRDLIEEMRNTNRNLERLVDAITRGAREGAEEEPEGTTEQIDKWDMGNSPAGSAETAQQYINLRRRSANSPNVNVPRVDVRNVDDPVQLYLDVYMMFGEHLQKISNSLNNDQWERFVQLLAIEYGAEEELVNILDPIPATLGIRVVRREVQILQGSTHMYFTESYGNYWFAQSEFALAEKYGSIADALQIIEDPNAEAIIPDLSPREMNIKLAKSIADRNGLDLPPEYIPLLD